MEGVVVVPTYIYATRDNVDRMIIYNENQIPKERLATDEEKKLIREWTKKGERIGNYENQPFVSSSCIKIYLKEGSPMEIRPLGGNLIYFKGVMGICHVIKQDKFSLFLD